MKATSRLVSAAIFLAILLVPARTVFAEPTQQGAPVVEHPFLLAEAHLRYAASIDLFDAQAFLAEQGSPLSYATLSDEADARLADVVLREAHAYGINPRVLLTLMEIRSQAVTTQTAAPSAASITNAAAMLNEALERGRMSAGLDALDPQPGQLNDLGAWTNPASYAVYSLAYQWGIPDWYDRLTDAQTGFVATYTRWFGSPLDAPAYLPDLPADVSANWLFPYQTDRLKFTSGPHAYGAPLSTIPWTSICGKMLLADAAALDFALGRGSHILAIEGGIVRHVQHYADAAAWTVIVEHDSGAASYYAHMESVNPLIVDMVGQRVPRGFWLGGEGNGNGQWPYHLHLEVRRGGTGNWWGVNSGTPVSWEGLQVDGWTSGMHKVLGTQSPESQQGYAYQGSLVSGAHERRELRLTMSACGHTSLSSMLVSTAYPVSETGENNAVDSRTVFAGADKNGVETRLLSHNRETEAAEAVDIALIIDSSGSMSSNDPRNMRRDAAKVFIGAMQADDQVAVIDFDHVVRVPFSLQRVGIDRSAAYAAVNTIDSSGNTNLRAALQTGLDQLNRSTADNKKAAVFLTDGYDTAGNSDAAILSVASQYAANGWRVFTVGLVASSSVDEALLRQIATSTGGQYEPLTSPDDLVRIYNTIQRKVTGGTIVYDQTVQLNPGQTRTLAVTAPGGQATASFLVTWQGSRVDTTLIDPNGRVITPALAEQDPLIEHQKGLTYEFYRVSEPRSGQWQVTVYGADLPAGGEQVGVQVSVRPIRAQTTLYLPLVLRWHFAEPGPTSTPTATPTATPQPKGTVSAVQFVAPPNIDGEAVEWSSLPAEQLDAIVAEGRGGPEPHPGLLDASLSLSAAWDRQNLYFQVLVHDDIVLTNESAVLWEDDTVELGVQANGHTWQFSFAADGRRGKLQDGSIQPEDHTLAATRPAGGGWQIEIALPASEFGLVEFDAGAIFPFTFGYWDDDNGGMGDSHLVRWGNSTNSLPGQWGQIQLSSTSIHPGGATPTPVPPVQTSVSSRRFVLPPVLDGSLGDWSKVPPVLLDDQRAEGHGGVEKHPSPADLSLTLHAGWDGGRLYFGVAVQDDWLLADSANLWDDDALELGIHIGGHVRQYTFTSDGRFSELIDGSQRVTPDLASTLRRTAAGWDLEISLPSSGLGTGLAEGSVFPFTVGYWDDDNGGPGESHLVLWGASTNSDPQTWGSLRLEGVVAQ